MSSIKTYSLLLCFAALLFCSAGYAQQQVINLPGGEIPAGRIISLIEDQTGYKFVIRSSELDLAKKVRTGGAEKLDDLLCIMLEGTGRSYGIDGKYIIIPLGGDTEKTTETRYGTVSGTVYGPDDSTPLAGVMVGIAGSAHPGAVTDSYGQFTLGNVPSGNHVLKFTAAGGSINRYREVNVWENYNTRTRIVINGDGYTEPDATDEPRSQKLAPAVPVTPEIKTEMPAAGVYKLTRITESPREYRAKAAVKTNLLYWATTSPNVALEFSLGRKWTFNAFAGYNAWKMRENSGLLHWLVQPEVRYWFCEAFERHFIGLHGIYGRFDFNDVALPFTDVLEGHQYKGYGIGGGIAWGYHLPLKKRWAMEFSLGVGYVYFEYNKLKCNGCQEFEGRYFKHYIGPTKASVSMVFMLR